MKMCFALTCSAVNFCLSVCVSENTMTLQTAVAAAANHFTLACCSMWKVLFAMLIVFTWASSAIAKDFLNLPPKPGGVSAGGHRSELHACRN